MRQAVEPHQTSTRCGGTPAPRAGSASLPLFCFLLWPHQWGGRVLLPCHRQQHTQDIMPEEVRTCPGGLTAGLPEQQGHLSAPLPPTSRRGPGGARLRGFSTGGQRRALWEAAAKPKALSWMRLVPAPGPGPALQALALLFPLPASRAPSLCRFPGGILCAPQPPSTLALPQHCWSTRGHLSTELCD